MTEAAQSAAERNIKLVVAYDGTRYHGWQRQIAGVDSVQERLEWAAVRVLGHPVHVHGAGRTDAGVHAAGQVANFRTTCLNIPVDNLRRAINSKLPSDIAVLSAKPVSYSFHASGSATGKTYRYRIYTAQTRSVTLANCAYHYWQELDVDRMAAAGRRLLGTHDFRGLAFSAEKRENTVRTITGYAVSRVDQEIQIHVSGDGFLYKMVRNLAGTLLEIGRGHWEADRVDQILATRDRTYAGPTLPPNGLCMMAVYYPPEVEVPESLDSAESQRME